MYACTNHDLVVKRQVDDKLEDDVGGEDVLNDLDNVLRLRLCQAHGLGRGEERTNASQLRHLRVCAVCSGTLMSWARLPTDPQG